MRKSIHRTGNHFGMKRVIGDLTSAPVDWNKVEWKFRGVTSGLVDQNKKHFIDVMNGGHWTKL